ncbi:major facilitator superfamily domain-containing protein [Anaeramoeba flamelloides]|uniref:Major facilitator superfamily domain-containing protein n=1 Tax=Anaeramoeba flamelloides TaxID=1746091 RepID=A0AAV7ZSJ6_9EUKA|nr:major facilitator superfamily domain-containing protein [Anaeramoeba flamelloides]
MLKQLPRTLWFACYSNFFLLLTYSVVVSVLGEQSRLTGASSSFVGFILGCYSITEFFGNIGLGYLSDRFGRAPMLFISNIGLAISVSLTGLSENKWYLLSVRLLSGLFSGIYPVGQATIKDYTNDIDVINKLMGLILFSHGTGFVLGPILDKDNNNSDNQNIKLKKKLKTDEASLINKCENEIITEINNPVDKRNNNANSKSKINDETIIDKKEIQLESEIDDEPKAEEFNEFDEEKVNSRMELMDFKSKGDKEKKTIFSKDLFTKDLVILYLENFIQIIPIEVFLLIMPLFIVDIYHLKASFYSSLMISCHGLIQQISCYYYTPWITKKLGETKAWNYTNIILIVLLPLFNWADKYWIFFILYSSYVFFFCTIYLLCSSLLIKISPNNCEGTVMGIGMIFQSISTATSPIYSMLIYKKKLLWLSILFVSLTIFGIFLFLFVNFKKKETKTNSKKNSEKNSNRIDF